MDEVVVTARRTGERLQEVPISISVLDDKALTERGISTSDDLSTAIPGLSGANSQQFTKPTSSSFSIRGQGEAFLGSAPGVPLYVDDVANFSSFVYDLENVQVLKGPQGTLFGKNTTGGAILLVTRRPTDEFSAFGNVRLTNYDGRAIDFGIGGSVVQGILAVRLAGQGLRRDGYVTNLDPEGPKTLANQHRESVRLSAVWTPTPGIDNQTILQYDDYDENGVSQVIEYIGLTTPYGLELGPYLEEQEARGPYRVEANGHPYVRYKGIGAINQTSWTLDDSLTLKNIVSFTKTELYSRIDADGSGFPIVESDSPRDENDPTHRWTEELQLLHRGDRLRTVLGLYYDKSHQQRNLVRNFVNGPGSTSLLPVPILVTTRGVTTPNFDRSYAAYLQSTLSDWLIPDMNLTLGARYTKDLRQTDLGITAAIGACCEPAPELVSIVPFDRYQVSSSAVTWNASLDYKWTDDLMTYGSIRRGYKAGGINAATDRRRLTYKPEFVTDFEVGVKSDWMLRDAVLRCNVDLFYDDYTDIQRYAVVNGIPLPSNVVSNAAKGTIQGVDLGLTIRADWYGAELQYTFLHTGYEKYEDLQYGDQSDSEFPNAPVHQLTLIPRVHLPLAGRAEEVSASATYFWQSATAFSIPNRKNGESVNDDAIAGSNGSAFYRIDLRTDWHHVFGSDFSLGLFAQNVTDEVYRTGSTNTLGTALLPYATYFYGVPRIYGVELHYEF